jgi:hypothetical protein
VRVQVTYSLSRISNICAAHLAAKLLAHVEMRSSVVLSLLTTGLVSVNAQSADCADIDASGTVGVGDLLALLAGFGGADTSTDISGDGETTVTDLLKLLGQFGSDCTRAVAGGGDGVNAWDSTDLPRSGACNAGYVGGDTNSDTLDGCIASCNAHDTCKFVSYCPDGGEFCLGGHINMCARYTSCPGSDVHSAPGLPHSSYNSYDANAAAADSTGGTARDSQVRNCANFSPL